MRMRELVRAAGVPRTTVHHYLREGLLPPPRKTAANAAVYGDEHVERLKLIRALRGPELGPFPVAEVRGILSLIDSGVKPVVAARLRKAAGSEEAASAKPGKGGFSHSDVARAADVPVVFVEELARRGLLMPAQTDSGTEVFAGADLEIVRVYERLLRDTRLEPEDLSPIAELIKEILRYESALADVATAELGQGEGAVLRGRIARRLDAVHAYLLAGSGPEDGSPS